MSESKAPVTAFFLAVIFLILTAVTIWGLGLDFKPPEVATNHGQGVDAVISYLLICTGVIFIVGHLVLAYFVVKFSRKGGQGYKPVSPRTEMWWAIIPVLLMCVIAEGGVLFVGMPAFLEVYGETPDDALEIEVVGKQFEWFFRLPGEDGVFGQVDAEKVHDTRNPLGLVKKDEAAQDDIVLRGELHIPVNRNVVLRLRSLDVLHSFTVPDFRIKQDTIPGFVARTQFKVVKTGEYEVACAELCGLGHFRMRAYLTVDSEEDYKTWLEDQDTWF